THRIGKARKSARGFLQPVDGVGDLGGNRGDVGDLPRQWFYEVESARKLRERRRLVIIDQRKRAAGGLGELPRVGEHASLAAQRLLFRRIDFRGGDLVDLIAKEIEPQRAV